MEHMNGGMGGKGGGSMGKDAMAGMHEKPGQMKPSECTPDPKHDAMKGVHDKGSSKGK